jgi:hypothetical protein
MDWTNILKYLFADHHLSLILGVLGTILIAHSISAVGQYAKANREIKEVVERAKKRNLFPPADVTDRKWILWLGVSCIIIAAVLNWEKPKQEMIEPLLKLEAIINRLSSSEFWWKLSNITVLSLVVVVALFQEKIKAWWSRTELSIKLLNPLGDLTKQNNGLLVYYYHLEVVNRYEKRPAKNVRVVLSAIYRLDKDGKFYKVRLSGLPQLIWMPKERHNDDPFPTIVKPRLVDFGCLTEEDHRFRPSIEWIPNNFRGFVEANNTVRYAIEVDSENSISKKPLYVEVSWDGVWEDNEVKMKNHLKVREIRDKNWLPE